MTIKKSINEYGIFRFNDDVNCLSISLLSTSSESSDDINITDVGEKNNGGDYDKFMDHLQNIQKNIIAQRTIVLKKYVCKLLAECKGELTIQILKMIATLLSNNYSYSLNKLLDAIIKMYGHRVINNELFETFISYSYDC